MVSAIADLAALPAGSISIWLAVNGVIGGTGAVARSGTTVALSDATTQHTVAVSLVYNFAQGDYFELWYGGTDTDVLFNATAIDAGPPYIPASPSVIMTVKKNQFCAMKRAIQANRSHFQECLGGVFKCVTIQLVGYRAVLAELRLRLTTSSLKRRN